MIGSKDTRASRIRRELGHPVIDADGHYIETPAVFQSFFLDYVRDIGGADLALKFEQSGGLDYDGTVLRPWSEMDEQTRRDMWLTRPPWWSLPASSTIDRATAHIPKLMYERLPDFGIDFVVLYPSRTLTTTSLQDTELRQVACRALNKFNAELYAPFKDRMTPVAQIPMHTPEEAIAELEHAVGELGLKSIMIAGLVHRPIGESSDAADGKLVPNWGRGGTRIDSLGVDSEYDYDPFWQKCMELKVSPATHSAGMGWGARQSISSYMFNHIGNFGAAMDTSCKSLFMGGVTRRFPEMPIGLLEGGVTWAVTLLGDIEGHWSKRNKDAIQQYNPANIDRDELLGYLQQYGDGAFAENVDAILEGVTRLEPEPPVLDEWEACGVSSKQEIYDSFVNNFYFGCEADDPGVAIAFNRDFVPGNNRLRPMFSSDMGHWDVEDMEDMLCEAYELVEDELITHDDFREFTLENPARFYAGINRDFFKGTAVEAEVSKLLAEDN